MATKSSKTTGRSKSGKRAGTKGTLPRRTTVRSRRKSMTTSTRTARVARAASVVAPTTYNDCNGYQYPGAESASTRADDLDANL